MSTQNTDNLTDALAAAAAGGEQGAAAGQEDTTTQGGDQGAGDGTQGGDQAGNGQGAGTGDNGAQGGAQGQQGTDAQEFLAKFEGKSREDIIEMYRNLEHLFGKRSISAPERQAMAQQGVTRKDLDTMNEAMKQLEEEFQNTDFTKMEPAAFAMLLVKKISAIARAEAENVYSTSSQIQERVKQEVSEASKEYPLLQSSEDFRSAVLAFIQSAQSRGEVLGLKEACAKVQALMGKGQVQATTTENANRAARAAVETGTENTSGGTDDEEESVLKGILGAGTTPGSGFPGV